MSEEDLIERFCEVQGFLRGVEEPTQGEKTDLQGEWEEGYERGFSEAIEAAAKVLDSYAEEMADEAVAQFANLAASDVRALSRPPSETVYPAHEVSKITRQCKRCRASEDVCKADPNGCRRPPSQAPRRWTWPEVEAAYVQADAIWEGPVAEYKDMTFDQIFLACLKGKAKP